MNPTQTSSLRLLEDRAIYKDAASSGRFPSGGVLADGRMVVAFNIGKSHVDPAARRGVLWSRDDGRTWEGPRITSKTDGPAQLNQLPDGVVASLNGWGQPPFPVSETRDGETWSKLTAGLTDSARPNYRWGRLVALSPDHWLYPVYSHDETGGVKTDAVYCLETTDRGASWITRSKISGPLDSLGVNETFLFRAASGRLVAFLRTAKKSRVIGERGAPLALAVSTDDGRSWSPAKVTSLDFGEGVCFILRLIRAVQCFESSTAAVFVAF